MNARRTLDALALLAAMRLHTPAELYAPHAGQLAFHAAPHRVRALWVGNRWGKSTALAVEAHRCVQAPGRIVVWICPQFRQFEALRPQLQEQVFGPAATFVHPDLYRWGNGSQMFIVPRERDWTFIAGINPDLVCVDEECPLALWRELRARGAGARRTRYVIGATAVGGDTTWMEEELYQPWMAHHRALGLDEAEAIRRQAHPEIWALPCGGIADNTALSEEARSYFLGLRWSGPKEEGVRQRGGFAQWVGDPVFDEAGIERMRRRMEELERELGPGETGGFEAERRVCRRPVAVERRRR